MFGFELDGEVVGTIRIVPMGYGLTLAEALLAEAALPVPDAAAANWEVGRLVLAPEFRSDVDALRHCLLLALTYACRHSHVERLHATCTHVLSRLYRRFGFAVDARDVPLRGTEKTYTLISGTAAAVSAGLAQRAPAVPTH